MGIPELTARHLFTIHGAMVVLGLIIYVTASHVRRQRRHPSAAIAWVISLALMPYVALPLYLLFGNRKVLRGEAVRVSLPAPAPADARTIAPAARFQQLAGAMGLPPAAGYEELAVHEDGQQALDALTALMKGATWTLDVCTFLIGRDAVGDQLTAMLARRAREGVRVRLLLDGVGVYFGGRPRLRQLTDAGVQVALFVSPWRSPLPGRTNLRNHRKMAIADARHLWCGGRNLAAEYFVGDLQGRPDAAPWIDLSFDLRGDVARQAQERFDQDWAFAGGSLRRDAVVARPPADAVSRSAQLIPSGPDQSDDTVYSLLISGCFAAQSRIVAVTPYFVPDSTLLLALTLAARRGVAVDLVLPQRSNHRLADMARPSALRDMTTAGARVWLAPGMIHAKAIIIDDDLALAGSANLDERSLFLNYELMVAFYDRGDVQRFAQWIERHRAGAQQHRARPPGFLREVYEGLVRWLVFQL